ncbi:MAG: alpha/beta hydrolase [Alphaproteobacteria bacterium]|jgi:dienelactone hydrolase
MRRAFAAAIIGCFVSFSAFAADPASVAPSLSADAQIETLRLGALDLKARHVRPKGSGLATALIIHDTLGAFDNTTIADVQWAMAENGNATLAINLGLNVNERLRTLDCNVRHTHRHEDALSEIDAWVDWLLGEGLGPITLIGHGRGGAQAAWHLSHRANGRVSAAVLLAPSGWSPGQADAEYRARYTAGLSALLTQIAGKAPEEMVENVPFLHCGAVAAAKSSIVSYYGAEPMRDTPTALAGVNTPTLVLLPEVVASAPEDDSADRLLALENPSIAVQTIRDADSQFSGVALTNAMTAMDAYLRSIFAGKPN